MKKFISTVIIFVGFMLSPLTWWNDAFINLPVSYLFANLAARIDSRWFIPAMLIGYWFTNVFGIWLMYIGGRQIAGFRNSKPYKIYLTVTLYSVGIILLIKLGILRPI